MEEIERIKRKLKRDFDEIAEVNSDSDIKLSILNELETKGIQDI